MIELRNINFCYSGEKDAGGLHNINLTIPDGEILLLCGQSGCGKTTLTRLINGLVPNYYDGELTGSVLLNGKNVSELPLYETAKQVGSVFQNPRTQFFTVDSTSELAFGCENQGLPESEIIRRVETTANQFGISSLLGKSIFEMSGGEKQKIACASVSVSDPAVIVLDEPSSSLDISATADLRRLIRIWRKQGKTVIIAEHRLYYLKGLLDRVIFLKDGCIEKELTEADLKEFTIEQQMTMGLRPFELSQFPVSINREVYAETFECSDFEFSYTGRRAALQIKALSLPQNSVIAVIGHNGAGKSTFARCLCGLEKRCKGVVTISGKNYKRKQRLSRCYMVMQDVNHQLFTESTEEEMLISRTKSCDYSIDMILERLDLLPLKERHPMSLSGGQKQRVAIATALISGKEILVFDEPTSGLDLQHMKEVARELSLLRQMKKTSLVITHDYELIVSSCTHVLHLEQGEVRSTYALDEEGVKHLKDFFLEARC